MSLFLNRVYWRRNTWNAKSVCFPLFCFQICSSSSIIYFCEINFYYYLPANYFSNNKKKVFYPSKVIFFLLVVWEYVSCFLRILRHLKSSLVLHVSPYFTNLICISEDYKIRANIYFSVFIRVIKMKEPFLFRLPDYLRYDWNYLLRYMIALCQFISRQDKNNSSKSNTW